MWDLARPWFKHFWRWVYIHHPQHVGDRAREPLYDMFTDMTGRMMSDPAWAGVEVGGLNGPQSYAPGCVFFRAHLNYRWDPSWVRVVRFEKNMWFAKRGVNFYTGYHEAKIDLQSGTWQITGQEPKWCCIIELPEHLRPLPPPAHL